jgi:hypothetical protein
MTNLKRLGWFDHATYLGGEKKYVLDFGGET